MVALVLFALPRRAEPDPYLGLGSAVAHRGAQLVNKALNTQVTTQHSTGLKGPIVFTNAPIDLPTVDFLEPLGNLNPPGHTFPTDHIYFYYVNLGFPAVINPITTVNPTNCKSGCPVYAPADGYLSNIRLSSDNGGTPNQYNVTFTHTDTFSSYLDHLTTLDPSILAQAGRINPSGNNGEWIPVKAGEVVGTVGGVSGENALDFGVTNLQITQPFINPSHYGFEANSDSPIKYYADPLKSMLYGMVGRQTPDHWGRDEKDGIFCYDLPNTVLGNWAIQGSDPNWTNPDSWSQQLSFSYDSNYSSQMRITFGGESGVHPFGVIGAWMVQPGALAFESVTAITGAYGYQIYGWDPNTGNIDLNSGINGSTGPKGLFMIQLIDNNTLKAEYFAFTAAVTTLPFDSNAVYYNR